MTDVFNGRLVVARRVLIKFKSRPTARELAAIAAHTSATYLEPIGGAGWYRLDASSIPVAELEDPAGVLRSFPGVEKIEPDYVGHPEAARIAARFALRPRPFDMVPTDPSYPLQWAYDNIGQTVGGISGTPGADINAQPAWDLARGNTSVAMVDFDTGIDYNNPDLAANVWSAPSAYTISEGGNIYNCPAGSHGFSAVDGMSGCAGQAYDDDTVDGGHGTFMAGIMGAVTNNGVGIAGTDWNASMISIGICTALACDSSTAITGIDAALQIAQRFGLRLVAGNMSHGNLGGSALEDEMALAGSRGMLFVASTGNECNSSADDPASFYLSNEIAVSASDQQLLPALWSGGQCSNGGGDIAAPGTNVYTTRRADDGNNPALIAGTSASAPFVTGAIALLASACPLPPSAIKATLLGTAAQIPALAAIATDGRRLDLGNAVESCAAPGHTAGTGTITVWLPGPTPDHSGTMTVTLLGETYSYGYDTAVDDTESVARALAGQLSGNPYFNAVYEGGGEISLTSTAAGPYTGYTILTNVQDSCDPYYGPLTHGGGGCGDTPRISSTGLVAGY